MRPWQQFFGGTGLGMFIAGAASAGLMTPHEIAGIGSVIIGLALVFAVLVVYSFKRKS